MDQPETSERAIHQDLGDLLREVWSAQRFAVFASTSASFTERMFRLLLRLFPQFRACVEGPGTPFRITEETGDATWKAQQELIYEYLRKAHGVPFPAQYAYLGKPIADAVPPFPVKWHWLFYRVEPAD